MSIESDMYDAAQSVLDEADAQLRVLANRHRAGHPIDLDLYERWCGVACAAVGLVAQIAVLESHQAGITGGPR